MLALSRRSVNYNRSPSSLVMLGSCRSPGSWVEVGGTSGGGGEAFIHSSLQVFPLRPGSNLLNCSLCKCYANDRVSAPLCPARGEGWADSPGFPLAKSVLLLLQRGARCWASSDNTSPQGREGETPKERETKKAPVIGQPRHRHNHQHQKGLWKRQIFLRPVPATL